MNNFYFKILSNFSGSLHREVCGEFDAKYYTDYLTKKYSELYGL